MIKDLHSTLRSNVKLNAVYTALQESVKGDDDGTGKNVLSATELFLSSLTALEGTIQRENPTGEMELLQLLEYSLSSHNVNEEIFHSQFSLLSRVLRAALQAHTDDDNTENGGNSNALLRQISNVSQCALTLLPRNEKEASRLLNDCILSLFRSSSPKIRRCAHGNCMVLLQETSGMQNVFSTVVGEYAQNVIKQCAKQFEHIRHEDIPKVMHILNFMQGALVYFPHKQQDAIVQNLLSISLTKQLNTSDSQRVVEASLQSLVALVEHEKTNPSICIKVLASLLQHTMKDVQETHIVSISHLIASSAVSTLSDTNIAQVGWKLFGTTVDVLVNILSMCNSSDTASSVSSDLQRLFSRTSASDGVIDQSAEKALGKIVYEGGKFRNFWSISLPMLGHVICAMYHNRESAHDKTEFVEVLRPLARYFVTIHSNAKKSNDSSSISGVEAALRTVLENFGGSDFANLFPMIISEDDSMLDENTLFILDFMKNNNKSVMNNVHNLLSDFRTKLLPLARVCDKNGQKADCVSTWGTLPLFCHRASDLSLELPNISPILSKAIGDYKRYEELPILICGALVSLISTFDDSNEDDLKAVNNMTIALLPPLFKYLEHTQDTNDSIISALAHLLANTPSSNLSKLFKKLLTRLLSSISSNDKDNSKIVSYLSLAGSLVLSGKLSDESTQLLFRSIQPLLTGAGNVGQKKAYKLLLDMINHSMHCLDDDQIVNVLTEAMLTCHVSARTMRLKCLTEIVKAYWTKQATTDKSSVREKVASLVPECLLCLKDSNGKARESAYNLLDALYICCGDTMEFLKMIVAALGAKTTHMQSAAIMALSRTIFKCGRIDERLRESIPNIVKTCLILSHDSVQSREIAKAVVGLVRISVAVLTGEELSPLLPELLSALLSKRNRSMLRFRRKIKIVLKILVRKCGSDVVGNSLPTDNEEGGARLLKHVRKLAAREQRKKERGGVVEENIEDFEEMMEDDEEDSLMGRTLVSGVTHATSFSRYTQALNSRKNSSNGSVMTTKTKLSKVNKDFNLQIKEGKEVLDMLDDSNVGKHVHFADDDDSMYDSDDSGGAMEFDASGRLIVEEDDASKNTKTSNTTQNKRRKSLESSASVGSKFQQAKEARKAAHQKRNEKHKMKKQRQLGAAYKSSRAGGDVKHKNQKYEPYAYMPLDARNFSKKNRRGAVEMMEGVVRGGKKTLLRNKRKR